MHALDMNEDGTANLVLNRLPGWHQLGTVWEPGDAARLDLGLALELANLNDWDVRTVPVFGEEDGETIDADAWRLTVRNNPTNAAAPAQPLGMVGADYVPIQNETSFAFGEALIDEGLEVEAAGAIYGGRQTFVLFRVPTTVSFGGEAVVPFLHVSTSHDGSMAVTAKSTGVRVLCANTQAMSLADGLPVFKARHSGEGLAGKLADARDALGITYQGLDAFQKDVDRWLGTPSTEDTFEQIIARQFGKPEADDVKALASYEKRAVDLRVLRQGPTNAAIGGTAWGDLQTLLEWDEWIKGSDKRRAARTIGAQAEAFRGRAVRNVGRVLELVN